MKIQQLEIENEQEKRRAGPWPVHPGFKREAVRLSVKKYLASKQLPLEILFLGASNSGKIDAKPDAKWMPRTDLNIGM